MEIEIFDKTKKIEKRELAQIKKFVCSFVKKTKTKGYLSISFVSKAQIKRLNFKHRKKNQPTDVLSFSAATDKSGIFGDVVICPKIAKEKQEDPMDLIKHGFIHLMGYDHHSKKQKRAWDKIEKKYMYL